MGANLRSLHKALCEQGWRLDQTNQGHWKATPPTPDGGVVYFSNSDDPRAFKNAISELRHGGFQWPWRKPKVRKPGESTCTETAPPPSTEELVGALTDARDYYYLALEEVATTVLALGEAELAHENANKELEVARRSMRKAKAAFDAEFELPEGTA